MSQLVLKEFKAESGARTLPRFRKLRLIWQINGLNTDGGEQLSGYLKSIIQICIINEGKFMNPRFLNIHPLVIIDHREYWVKRVQFECFSHERIIIVANWNKFDSFIALIATAVVN